MSATDTQSWTRIYSASDLAERTKAIVKQDGKQILLWRTEKAIYACNNRCPHEGYPLAEGTMAEGCILTCNWHNWKFDLESGETLVGGDALRLYPAKCEGDDILLDLSDPPPEELRAQALEGLREAFDEHEYERIARELGRFEQAGGGIYDALLQAFGWAADRYEFGITHAQAAAADWLTLRDSLSGAHVADRLVPAIEIVGHLSWDALMQRGPYPFAAGRAETWNAQQFEDAVESEDEAAAVRLLRAGLEDHGAVELRPALERAALRHYQNFGHTPIYLEKTFELVERFGERDLESLFLPLVRGLCMGAREDLIPEFHAYAPALEAWDETGTDVPSADDFRKAGVKACLDRISRAGGRVDELYDALMTASAEAMLAFDPQFRSHIDKPIQQNVDWLDFTHAVTHLNASRRICAHQPELWANAFAQTGCFLGRNATYVDWSRDLEAWKVEDPDAFLDGILTGMIDHDEPLYIYPAHVLKLATAVREEIALRPDAPFVPVLLAALNRFVNEPMKRKHPRRVARQALSFVEAQG